MNRFKSNEIGWPGFVLGLCCLLVVAASKASLPDGLLLDDPFHYGEYFAAISNFLSDTSSITPLTIHGALDYIPAWVAIKLFGPNNHFLPTWVLYRFLHAIAAVVLLSITFEITRQKPNRNLLLIVVAIFAPHIVSHKDLLLLLSIYFYWLIQNRNHSDEVSIILKACLGLCVALGLLWSFDRGIAGMVSLGLACILLGYRKRSFTVAFATFFVTIISLAIFFPPFSFNGYLENVQILIETSSQWSYGWQRVPVLLTILLGALNILAIWVLIPSFRLVKPTIENFANLLLLLVLSIFLFKFGSNRADLGHFIYGLWGLFLLSIYSYSTSIQINNIQKIVITLIAYFLAKVGYEEYVGYGQQAHIFVPIVTFLFVWVLSDMDQSIPKTLMRNIFATTLSVPLAVAGSSMYNAASTKGFEWLNYLFTPPLNSEIITDSMRWVSGQIENSGSHCVFDLSNNGVINGLTRLPSCSRFTYPVYAGPQHEQELIESVRSERPNAIVYSSTYWSFSIDNKTMHSRFPNLDEYLKKQYPVEKCSFGYCVRLLEPL